MARARWKYRRRDVGKAFTIPPVSTPGKRRCNETQVNRYADDFLCKLEEGGHVVHIDPKTGTRWGNRGHRDLSK